MRTLAILGVVVALVAVLVGAPGVGVRLGERTSELQRPTDAKRAIEWRRLSCLANALNGAFAVYLSQDASLAIIAN